MKNVLAYFTAFFAAGLACCAAYCSVSGLSQLFAGAATTVIIITSFLEGTKILVTIVLHNYAKQLSVAIRVYCVIGVVCLVLITSVGIYGFLSNGYQQTANKLELHTGEVGVLQSKKSLYEKSIQDNEKVISNKTKRHSPQKILNRLKSLSRPGL